MNLPNKITIFRVFMIPLFVVLALLRMPVCDVLAALVFGVASFSDFLDGMLARRKNLGTNFGKFLDPLADKMLVMAAMITLLAAGRLPAWVVIVILCREFAVDGLRMLAVEKGVVIAASVWGKRKTFSQMIMVILLLLQSVFSFPLYLWVCRIAIGAAVLLTVFSGYDYLRKGKGFIQ